MKIAFAALVAALLALAASQPSQQAAPHPQASPDSHCSGCAHSCC